jgi:hypothetical protein
MQTGGRQFTSEQFRLRLAWHAKALDKALPLPKFHPVALDKLQSPLSGLLVVFAMKIHDGRDTTIVVEKVSAIMLHGWQIGWLAGC